MTQSNVARLSLVVLAIGTGAWSCDGQARSERASSVVEDWLLCIECIAGELDSVMHLAATDEAEVFEALSVAFRDGPSGAQRSNMRHQIYGDWLAAEEVAPTGIADSVWVRAYVANYVNGYRHRAAVGLLALPGDDARQTLTEVLLSDSTLSVHTQETIQQVLGLP